MISDSEQEDQFALLRTEVEKNLKSDVDTVISHYLHIPSTESNRLHLDSPAIRSALDKLREINSEAKRSEEDMYQPALSDILNILASTVNRPTRRFRRGTDADTSQAIYPERKPDFLLVDCDFDDTEGCIPWHRVHAIVKVRCATEDGHLCLHTMVQIAEEARLHMTTHPFRLFSLVLVIHGSKFSVVVVDRAGVLCSPSMPVYDAGGLTSTFIAVVQQLCYDLDDRQLGLDPTATRESFSMHDTFPTYRIDPRMTSGGIPVPTDIGQLVAVDQPISSSASLFERGTAVWRATSVNDGNVRVVKTAWRRRDRIPEFVIYEHLRQLGLEGRPGIVSFVTGGDVVLAGQTAVSVNALRPADTQISEDIALYRVILASNGKPLWEFTDEQQFLRGLSAIIKGISFLDELGITHRDISAGNVLLSVNDPRPGYEGFIADFEFANFPDAVLETPQQRPEPATTGSLQYMAIEILKHLVKAQSRTDKPAPVVHATRHDLESLVYVMVYAAYRRVYTEAHAEDSEITGAQRQLFLADFEKFFGDVNPASVHEARQSMINRKDVGTGEPLRDNVFYHLPLGVETICSMFVERVRHQNPAFAYTTITQARANDPRMALVLQEFPDRFVIEAPHTPVIPLTCKDMLDDVQRLIKVFCQNPPVAPAA